MEYYYCSGYETYHACGLEPNHTGEHKCVDCTHRWENTDA